MAAPLAIAAVSAIPTLMQMMTPGPRRPQAPDYRQFALPDRSQYQNAILRSGFDPQSELYRLASDRMMEDINSQMVNRGLGISSLNDATMRSAMVELSNKMLENELQRRIQAFQAATGYDIANSNIQSGLAAQANQADWMGYNADMQSRNSNFNNMSNLVNLGLGAYGQQMQMDELSQIRQQNQANFDRMMGSMAPSGGMYSFQPGAPAFQGGLTPYRPY